METQRKTKKCPFCGEQIYLEALKCRFCCEFLQESTGLPVSNHARRRPSRSDNETASPPPDKQNPTLVVTPSLWNLTGTFIAAAIFFTLAAALLVCDFEALLGKANVQGSASEKIMPIIRLLGLALFCLTLINLLYRVAKLKSVRYEICPDRVEHARGIFSRRIDNLDMFRIIDLKLHRSLLDCLLGVGAVTLATKDESDPTFEFLKVRNPKKLYDYIKQANLAADRKQGVIHID